MTYGVDQCRCCGTQITVVRAESLKEYTDALRRKPTMPEAQWRQQGFLAMPTPMQLHHVAYGCCQPCAEVLIKRKMGAPRRIAMVGVGAAIAFTLIWRVVLFMAG